MGIGGLAAVLSAGVCGACVVTSDALVDLSDRFVRLRDVARLDCVALAERERIGGLVVAALPDGVDRVELQRKGLESMARRRAPGLRFASGDIDGVVVFQTQPLPPPSPAVSDCYEAAHHIAARKALSRSDLTPTPCSRERRLGSLVYDRTHGVVRAADDLASGAYVGRIALPALTYPDTGDVLSLMIAIGPVRIERQVSALQPAPDAGRVFVRDDNDQIFSVPVMDLALRSPSDE